MVLGEERGWVGGEVLGYALFCNEAFRARLPLMLLPNIYLSNDNMGHSRTAFSSSTRKS